jgi:hypothetical protein
MRSGKAIGDLPTRKRRDVALKIKACVDSQLALSFSYLQATKGPQGLLGEMKPGWYGPSESELETRWIPSNKC